MPSQLNYPILHENLEVLSVEIFELRNMRGVMVDMRNGKGDCDP